jgi:hypothetical protein
VGDSISPWSQKQRFLLSISSEVIEVNGVIEVSDNSSAADKAHQSIVDNFERSDNFDNFGANET